MNRTLGVPSLARTGWGQAGLDWSTVRPITPENAVPGLYSLSVVMALFLLNDDQFKMSIVQTTPLLICRMFQPKKRKETLARSTTPSAIVYSPCITWLLLSVGMEAP